MNSIDRRDRPSYVLVGWTLRVFARTELLYAAALAFSFVLYVVVANRSPFRVTGAPGLEVFRNITLVNAWAVLGAGFALFGSPIPMERKNGTLGMLVLTGIEPRTLIASKVVPRAIAAVAVLLVQIPFTLLAIALGGVTWPQIFGAYLALLGFLVAVAGAATFSSIYGLRYESRTTALAFLLMATLLPTHSLQSLALALRAEERDIGPLPASIAESVAQAWPPLSVFERLDQIAETNSAVPIVTWQVLIHMSAGLLFFAASARVFLKCTIDLPLAAEPAAPPRMFQPRTRRSRRAWSSALVWKEYCVTSGGPAVSLAGTAIVLAACTGIAALMEENWPTADSFGRALGTIVLVLLLVGCFTAATVLESENKQKTLSSLVLLPLSTSQLVFRLLAGRLLAGWPLIILGLASLVLSPEVAVAAGHALVHPGIWFLLGALALVALGMHVMLAFSVAQPTTALHMAVYVGVPLSLFLVAVRLPRESAPFLATIAGIMAVLLPLLGCRRLHRALIRGVERLAGQDS